MPSAVLRAFLMIAACAQPLAAADKVLPVAVTLQGNYQRPEALGLPFAQSWGNGGLALVEWNPSPWAALGFGGYWDGYTEQRFKSRLDLWGLTLGLRLYAVRSPYLESYVLLLPGLDLSGSERRFAGAVDLGALFPLGRYLALDLGAGYGIRPGEYPIHTARAHFGVQARFGPSEKKDDYIAPVQVLAVAPTPEPTVEATPDPTPVPSPVPVALVDPGVGRYLASGGETLWSVASKPQVYGDGRLYPLLLKANAGLNRNGRLAPGQVLRYPKVITPAQKAAAIAAYKADDAADKFAQKKAAAQAKPKTKLKGKPKKKAGP